MPSYPSYLPAATGSRTSAPTAETRPNSGKLGGLVDADLASSLNRATSALSQRVDQLSSNATKLAQDFLSASAKQFLGDAANGLQVSFDQVDISAASRFAAAFQQTIDASGSQSATAVQLDDAASFKGHGFMTTADGKRFEFEVEVRYQSSLQMASSQTNSSSAASTVGAENAATPLSASHADARPLTAQFAGMAADLLDRLTYHDVRLPFSWEKDGKQGVGDLAVRLLNLPAGTRQLDLRDPANAAPSQVIDTQA